MYTQDNQVQWDFMEDVMRETVIGTVLSSKLIAIVRGLPEDKIIPLTRAINAGGIKLIEVTFNQKDPGSFASTARAIRAIEREFGKEVLAGAGTVCTEEQLKMAADAGALFMISPNTNTSLIGQVRKMGLVSIPGAMTPSECMTAHDAGADFVKLFPAGDLGPAYLKAISAPLNHIRFLAVGGITENNVKDYLAAGAKGFGIGGNLVNREWIETGKYDKITSLAKDFVNAVIAGDAEES